MKFYAMTGVAMDASAWRMYAGVGLAQASGAVVLAAATSPRRFVGYVNRFQIGPEERALQARFGEAYLRYRARTRRWL